MRSHSSGGWRLVVPVAFLVGAVAAPALAYHWHNGGWRDRHYNYPPKPSGYSQIVNVFGQPCTDRSNANSFIWKAADNDVWYTVNFHRKLGGSVSSNLNNDVRGHIGNAHLDWAVNHGIWGYNCRDTRSGGSTSTHAWGIAVDVSSAEEYAGKCHSTANKYHAQIWKDHRWTWGLAWCDPMHFQYASNY
ncbi:MAG: M15 family metallopeptidase [Actinomycetota bacterium]